MSKIRVFVVEDEFVIAEDIRSRLTQSGYEVTGVADRAEEAYHAIVGQSPDLLLVDVRLSGKMDGIEMVQKVTQTLNVPVIYITANSDTATYERAKLTSPHAFLVKPFSADNLLACVDLALYHFSCGSTPEKIERPRAIDREHDPFSIRQALFIRASGKYKKLTQEDILFVEASGSYVHVQTVTERFTLALNLSQFQRKASLPNLMRIHRSYMVNLARVDSFEESSVYLGNHKLPLSDNFRVDFLARVRTL